ncbi:MAG: HD domain-containing protein, partial [Bacillota bacterium]|nr:HD domain-containing protein [Bacillota bacterium]
MEDYNQFVRRLLLNYIIGSLLAIFGVGGITMFVSIKVGIHVIILLFFILMISIMVMFSVEGLIFYKHLKPIKRAFKANSGSNEIIENGIRQLYQLPEFSVKRIMLPHLLSFSIPAIIISLILIQEKMMNFPHSYVLYAFFASFLVAALHALIEYFLTIRTVHPAIEILKMKLQDGSTLMPKKEAIRVPIRLKMGIAIVLIGVFPVFLFLLAAQIKLHEIAGVQTNLFWNWAWAILAITVFYSVLISRIMAKDIEKPINQLQQMMKEAETQNYVMKENVYTDEFSDLFFGFNKMIIEIQKQNEKNEMMIESFLMVLSAALDARDPYTSGHSLRVADFSKRIGQSLGLPSHEVELLYKTSLLHDIGKIGVPDSILLKDGRLS